MWQVEGSQTRLSGSGYAMMQLTFSGDAVQLDEALAHKVEVEGTLLNALADRYTIPGWCRQSSMPDTRC